MSGGPCTHYDCTNRNSFGYCKNTVCINPNYSIEGIENTTNKAYRVINKPVTNADKIRGMSDEELAEWMNYNCDAYYAPNCGWPEWLKQEAE